MPDLPRGSELARRLRLILVTDPDLGRPRPMLETVRGALEGGCPAVQLRDKTASARDLLEQAHALRALTREYGALLFINDRADVALASGADGVHVGPDDVPAGALKGWLGDRLLIGSSTDDPTVAAAVVSSGADYIGCGAVFGTVTKDVGGEAIGPPGLARVVEAVDAPVVGIGGIDTRNVHLLPGTGAAGAAVVSAIMAADDPAAATRRLLSRFPG